MSLFCYYSTANGGQSVKAWRARGIPRGPRPAARANAADLARREVEVLRLVAEGLRNAPRCTHSTLRGGNRDRAHLSPVLSGGGAAASPGYDPAGRKGCRAKRVLARR